MKTPSGEKLQQAMQIFQTVQNHYFALAEKRDELGMTGIKAITVLTFAILRKISDGKMPSNLNAQDWMEIAAVVSQVAILADDQQYSIFVFGMYEKYIRDSVAQIEECISEVAYIEDCLWISLEAMVKLLACTAALLGDQRVTDFAQALASCAFEYGRLMLYSRELEIINQFIEAQYQLDAELEQKYAAYLEDLQKESEKFCMLIDNAFAPNFRDAFLYSIRLAKGFGVKNEELLSTVEDIDAFFLD